MNSFMNREVRDEVVATADSDNNNYNHSRKEFYVQHLIIVILKYS